MDSKKHPEQGYRACLGTMRLGEKYGEQRLEAACERALIIGSPSYKSIKSILENSFDKQPLPDRSRQAEMRFPVHDNIRGPEYYN